MRRIGIFFFFLIAGILPSVSLWAGPPFETDDPEPVDYRHWEIFLGGTLLDIQKDSAGSLPFLEVNYGPLPDVQLTLTEQAAFSFPSDGPRSFGYGDSTVGFKYRFLDESEGFPQAAIFPQVNLPTGNASRGLGAGQVQALLPLWFQKSWDTWSTYGGGGYWINPGVGNKDWIFAGWVLQDDLSKAFTLGGEVFFHSGNAVGVDDSVGFNLGGLVHLDDVNHILFSFGRDLVQSEYSFTGFAAYEWTFSMDGPEPPGKKN